MKHKIVHLIIACMMICLGKAGAQEVFYRDYNSKLITIGPDYYYPLDYSAGWMKEFRNPSTSRDLTVIPGAIVGGATDRWKLNSRAANFAASPTHLNGLKIARTNADAIINNKVINVSCWVKFDDDVYSGTAEGSILSTNDANKFKTEIVVVNKKVTISILSRFGSRVPIATMDFPIDWGSGDNLLKPGEETNGYFFFCLTAENRSNGQRTRIYVGRPGGRLYCRYYYFYPFENLAAGDDLFIGMRNLATRNPTGIDDLMFYTSGPYATRMLTTDEVLNNFYIQSPLYEGISYQMEQMHGIVGLESRSDSAVALDNEYLSMKSSQTTNLYGFDRFYIENQAGDANKAFYLRCMKNGAMLVPNFNYYIYTIPDPTSNHRMYRYSRILDDPSQMYTVNGSNIGQFRILDDYDPTDFLQSYLHDTTQYLDLARLPTGREANWRIRAANKVFRGPERFIEGPVQLRNYASGKTLDHEPGWGFYHDLFVKDNGDRVFTMMGNRNQTYPRNRFSSDQISMWVRRGYGPKDLREGGTAVVQASGDCYWEFIYVKRDINGKPLYCMRTSDGNVGFKMGPSPGEEYYVRQQYITGLNANGTIPDRFLWSIEHKGGYLYPVETTPEMKGTTTGVSNSKPSESDYVE